MDTKISIDGRQVHYRVQGDGPPILFVHGFPLSGRLWDSVVAELRSRYRCVVPDLRGHGESEATPSVTMGGYADDLVRLLDVLDEHHPAVVVGMSMGGYVAFELCRRYPARVSALALTNTRAQADTAEAARGRRETAQRVLIEGSSVVAEAMAGKLFGPDAPEELKQEWREIMAGTPPLGVAAALEAMASREASFDTLSGFQGPVLVVAGAEDGITPIEDAEAMCAAADHSRLVIIPGAGHMTPVERPLELSVALESFVDEAATR